MPDAQFEKYQVKYQKRIGDNATPIFVDIADKALTSLTIKNLDKATGYDISVRVKTHYFGYSDFSEPLVVYTKETSPSDETAVQKLEKEYVSYQKNGPNL